MPTAAAEAAPKFYSECSTTRAPDARVVPGTGINLQHPGATEISKIGCRADASQWHAGLGAQHGIDDVVVVTGFAGSETFHRYAKPLTALDVVPDNAVLRAIAFGSIQQATHDLAGQSSITTPVCTGSGGPPAVCG